MMRPSLAASESGPSTQTNFYTDVFMKAKTDEERETVIENLCQMQNRQITIVQILLCIVTVVRIGQYFNPNNT